MYEKLLVSVGVACAILEAAGSWGHCRALVWLWMSALQSPPFCAIMGKSGLRDIVCSDAIHPESQIHPGYLLGLSIDKHHSHAW